MVLAYTNPKLLNLVFRPKLNNVYDKTITKVKEIILLGHLNIDMMCTQNDYKMNV